MNARLIRIIVAGVLTIGVVGGAIGALLPGATASIVVAIPVGAVAGGLVAAALRRRSGGDALRR